MNRPEKARFRPYSPGTPKVLRYVQVIPVIFQVHRENVVMNHFFSGAWQLCRHEGFYRGREIKGILP